MSNCNSSDRGELNAKYICQLCILLRNMIMKKKKGKNESFSSKEITTNKLFESETTEFSSL